MQLVQIESNKVVTSCPLLVNFTCFQNDQQNTCYTISIELLTSIKFDHNHLSSI